MAEKTVETKKVSELECCPEVKEGSACDSINLRYLLPFQMQLDDKRQRVRAEVVLHFMLERCSGPVMMGDPIYSTTLMAGEKVRLFTSDRHTRWSFDSETNLSYRHETTSEESFFTAGMSRAMSDLTINESGSGSSTYEESWAEGGGGASLDLGIIEIGGGGGGGSYDSSSTYDFARSLSMHAQSASMSVAAGVRAKNATSIGEVEQRKHAEGESEAHYESASRMFSNPNKCSAITYLFHKLNKLQTIRFKLVAIERRIKDPAAPTGAHQRVPVDTTGRLTVLPQSITATNPNRLNIEQMARTSAAEHLQATKSTAGFDQVRMYSVASPIAIEPIDKNIRKAALEMVDRELASEGILDQKTGKPTEKIIAELSWEREEWLTTPGVVIKGCLDECQICEPALQEEISLDLERKKLENDLLQKQIELLDKSQEYRCYPSEGIEPEEPSDE